MATTRSAHDELARRSERWNGTIRLRRCPVCPVCATVLTPMDFAFVTGVAICGVCNRQQILPTLKAAQTLRHHAFSQHVTGCQGLAFYTPHVNGPPTVAALADDLGIGHVFAAMPVTPQGEHIRLEDYVAFERSDWDRPAVRDIENERDDLSSEGTKTRPDRLDELSADLARPPRLSVTPST